MEDLSSDAMRDVFLSVLLGCKTAEPNGDPVNSLNLQLVALGADISIGFPTKQCVLPECPEEWAGVYGPIADAWAGKFWPWAASEEYIPSTGGQVSVYEAARIAALDAVAEIRLVEPELPDPYFRVFEDLIIELGPGVTLEESLRPARYGNATN